MRTFIAIELPDAIKKALGELSRRLRAAPVATAFAGDMYRPWRNMASDYVMMMVLVASAFALYRLARRDQSTDPAANGSARAAEVATAEAASA